VIAVEGQESSSCEPNASRKNRGHVDSPGPLTFAQHEHLVRRREEPPKREDDCIVAHAEQGGFLARHELLHVAARARNPVERVRGREVEVLVAEGADARKPHAFDEQPRSAFFLSAFSVVDGTVIEVFEGLPISVSQRV
jgi:hypothetical protein